VAQTTVTTELAELTRQDLADADLIAHADDLEWLNASWEFMLHG
jgi:hypothetical protein